jgi:hypothetical protein
MCISIWKVYLSRRETPAPILTHTQIKRRNPHQFIISGWYSTSKFDVSWLTLFQHETPCSADRQRARVTCPSLFCDTFNSLSDELSNRNLQLRSLRLSSHISPSRTNPMTLENLLTQNTTLIWHRPDNSRIPFHGRNLSTSQVFSLFRNVHSDTEHDHLFEFHHKFCVQLSLRRLNEAIKASSGASSSGLWLTSGEQTRPLL